MNFMKCTMFKWFRAVAALDVDSAALLLTCSAPLAGLIVSIFADAAGTATLSMLAILALGALVRLAPRVARAIVDELDPGGGP